jgi:enamine deaminase RidA (YjgF/YER057c/UK114 family)
MIAEMMSTTIECLPTTLGPHYAFGYEGNLILKSAVVDLDKREVTLPLHRGRLEDGRTVWHVVTDASNEDVARAMGIIYSPKLANPGGRAVRSARRELDGTFVFERGAVDFSPERMLIPGNAPDYFPPMVAHAGSVADEDYSPLVRVDDVVFNATTLAFDVEANEIEFPDGAVDHRLVMDRVTAISPAAGAATFAMNLGTVAGRPIVFISLESNDHFVSAAEATTYTPALNDVSFGADNAPVSSVAVNYIMINGPTGDGNPQIQGVNSALSDATGQVFDIFKVAPGIRDGYSPMWDLYLGWWTDEAITRGYRARIHSDLEWRTLVEQGWITGKDGGPMGSVGLVSNCPLIMSW